MIEKATLENVGADCALDTPCHGRVGHREYSPRPDYRQAQEPGP